VRDLPVIPLFYRGQVAVVRPWCTGLFRRRKTITQAICSWIR
jgi:hypothetical protein